VKFLVIWKLELSLLCPRVAAAIVRMPAYAAPPEKSGQVSPRGPHGGAWLYDLGSNGELERLIALLPSEHPRQDGRRHIPGPLTLTSPAAAGRQCRMPAEPAAGHRVSRG
jgi:muconolactone D-isomerase